jgi:AGZA family xanthine/uracil permease-like MFS transporter
MVADKYFLLGGNMVNFFRLKENNTTVSTEVIAGVTTFFTMSYIIFVNPLILSQTGMPWGAVYLATILAAMVGTLVMGLFANVPYAQAAGMGLNAFFTYTVVFGLGFSWQQALGMVFLCGVVNILITVTRVRKMIILAIPVSLQNAISGGIGLFIAYIGLKNGGFLQFLADPGTYLQLDSGTVIANSSIVPELVPMNNAGVLLALFGLILTVILLVRKVKGALLLGIVITTIAGIPMGVVDLSQISSGIGVGQAFSELGTTFGAALGREGLLSLFTDTTKLPTVLITIFAFSLTDTFDTIGTFIGTGRRSGIFSEEDERLMMESTGFKSKMDKALFADAIATSIGAILGTSNVTTYVESAAGISVGGRTGLTSVVVAALFGLAIFLAPIAQLVPAQATSAALIAVGIMMLAAFKDIEWTDMDVAIPSFFASIFMCLAYSISTGIATGFIFYLIVKAVKGQFNEVHPIVTGASLLFVLNFVLSAVF